MKISVIIPAYNSGATIGETLDSVLMQTVPPEEVLVMDDGSTDDTVSVANSFGQRVNVSRQPNMGAAKARNSLCAKARGDLVAFLDSDDLWDRDYLKVQTEMAENHPEASLFFTGHLNRVHGGAGGGHKSTTTAGDEVRLIAPPDFYNQYTRTPGKFHMSFCCVRRRTLLAIGGEPFEASPAEDSYFKYLAALAGPVAYLPKAMGVVTIMPGSASANLLRSYGALVRGFDILGSRHPDLPDRKTAAALGAAHASTLRLYAKHLMGTGNIPEARRHFRHSFSRHGHAVSASKSLVLLLATYLPEALQPKWPSRFRS